MPDSAPPRFIAFISRREEIADYTVLQPQADFAFASFSDLGGDAVRIDPLGMDEAISVFSRQHRQREFTAVLNRKEKCVVPAARLALALGLPPITCEPELARDKYAMRRALNGGDKFPRTVLIQSLSDLEAVDENMFPCVLKPRFGFNSRSAVLAADHNELAGAYREQYELYAGLPKQDRTNSDFVVEELIPGSEHTVETLVKDGTPLFHLISDKLPMSPPFFVEIGDNMPSRLPEERQDACRSATERAIRALGIRNGWTHTEIKLHGPAAIVVECAARMGGGYFENLFQEVYGLNRMEMMASLFRGDRTIAKPVARAHAAARRIVVYGPRRMRSLENGPHLFADSRVRLVWPPSPSKIDRELAGPPFDFNNTLFEFISLGNSAGEAESLADALVAQARIRTGGE